MRKALYASLAGNVVLIVLLFVPFGKHPENADATAKSPETSLEKMSEPPKQGFDIMMLGNSLTYGGDWNKLLKRENVKTAVMAASPPSISSGCCRKPFTGTGQKYAWSKAASTTSV